MEKGPQKQGTVTIVLTNPKQSNICCLRYSTKKPKKAPIGGIHDNWEEHRRGRDGSTIGSASTVKHSSRAHSSASAGSVTSSDINLTSSGASDVPPSDFEDGSGVRLATFADDSDTGEWSTMADLAEDLSQLRKVKKLARQQEIKARSSTYICLECGTERSILKYLVTDQELGSRAQFNKIENVSNHL